jgi:parallel beta-helix repeat protein
MACPSRTALIISCLLIGLLTAPVWAQRTINVPGNAATIQAGINAAADGDTVMVAPGSYVENINFNGKAITVTSSGGPASTIIDGSQGAIAVSFASGETRTSVISGFTIENAGASMYPNSSPDAYFMGVNVGASSPTITNNVITKNYGYGINVYNGGALISSNTISHTATQYDPQFDYGCDYDDGDGIFVGGTPKRPFCCYDDLEQYDRIQRGALLRRGHRPLRCASFHGHLQ